MGKGSGGGGAKSGGGVGGRSKATPAANKAQSNAKLYGRDTAPRGWDSKLKSVNVSVTNSSPVAAVKSAIMKLLPSGGGLATIADVQTRLGLSLSKTHDAVQALRRDFKITATSSQGQHARTTDREDRAGIKEYPNGRDNVAENMVYISRR